MKNIVGESYIKGGAQKDFYKLEDTETTLCPHCCSSNFIKIHSEMGNLGIVDCLDCGLTYINPRVKNSHENYWGDPDIYFEEGKDIFNGTKSHHRDKNYLEELRHIKKFKDSGKLLDVGANMGFFLRKANEKGFDAIGLDPSESLSELGKKHFGLNIENSYLNNCSFKDKTFDVITLIDVFEHLTDPIINLKKIRSLLKDDGIVCIKVPNANYNKLKLKIFKFLKKDKAKDIFDSYEHVVHYNPTTMKNMVQKCGFKIIDLFLPMPIQLPVWHKFVGHYYLYPSPFRLDWKTKTARNIFHYFGKIEKRLNLSINFATDLMFILKKN